MSALFKISYGLYLVAVKGDKHTGCICNTLMQQSNDKVSIALNKSNYTHEVLKATRKTSVSILSMEVDPALIKTFGTQSGREVDKFDGIVAEESQNGCLVLKEGTCGYLELEILEEKDLGSHTLFISKIVGEKEYDKEPVTYAYYRKNMRSRASAGYECIVCGHVRSTPPQKGEICPICKHADVYREVNNTEKSVKFS